MVYCDKVFSLQPVFELLVAILVCVKTTSPSKYAWDNQLITSRIRPRINIRTQAWFNQNSDTNMIPNSCHFPPQHLTCTTKHNQSHLTRLFSMEEEKQRKAPPCEHPGLSVGVSVSLTLVVILVAVVGYGGYYTVDRFGRMSEQYDKMAHDYEIVKSRLEHLEQVCENTEDKHGEKREVLSSSKVDIPSLLRGPPGPTGPAGSRGIDGRDGRPGRDGLPGKDGTDFASLSLMESLLNRTIQKEWTQLSGRLPTYSGAVYTLWGRKKCSKESKLIYTGAMAGPDTRSSGGASNHQCLPSDPQYHSSTNPAKAYHSSLRPTQYYTKFMPDLLHLLRHYVPCAVCETMQRVSTIMIPAMTQCPTSEWVLEYNGYLMSEIEHTNNKPDNFDQTRNRASVDYICLDRNAESLTSNERPQEVIHGGAVINPVDADCSGVGGLTNCPPYHGNNLALACVVCSK